MENVSSTVWRFSAAARLCAVMESLDTKPGKPTPRHHIKQWRKAAGLSQEQIAELIGVTHGAISQLERGLTSYTQDTLEKLAKAFECGPGDLINGPPDAASDRERLARFRVALEIFESLSAQRQDRVLGAIEDAARAEGLEFPPLVQPDQAPRKLE